MAASYEMTFGATLCRVRIEERRERGGRRFVATAYAWKTAKPENGDAADLHVLSDADTEVGAFNRLVDHLTDQLGVPTSGPTRIENGGT